MIAFSQSVLSSHQITWSALPDDFPLPDDPVENEDHPPLANALTQSLSAVPALLHDALITSNFSLCAGIDGRTICKAPDWMYVKPVEPKSKPRRSYTPHAEGPIPLIVMEFLCETDGGEYSMESGQKIGKWFFYERVIQAPYYVIFAPASGELEVYHLEEKLYQKQTPDAHNQYWIDYLDLSLGIWDGQRDTRTGRWLRWWNVDGIMLPLPEERARQAENRAQEAEAALEQERQEKEALLEKLRAAGLEP
ncbi:MAG: Uma2 family endonuclease [Elainellaceae cyanobacterium]